MSTRDVIGTLRTLRKDVEVMREMPRVQADSFCQVLLALVDALEVEVARPYDEGWNHKIAELAALPGLDGGHPSNVIDLAIRKLTEGAS